jgi:hypothetical protein
METPRKYRASVFWVLTVLFMAVCVFSYLRNSAYESAYLDRLLDLSENEVLAHHQRPDFVHGIWKIGLALQGDRPQIGVFSNHLLQYLNTNDLCSDCPSNALENYTMGAPGLYETIGLVEHLAENNQLPTELIIIALLAPDSAALTPETVYYNANVPPGIAAKGPWTGLGWVEFTAGVKEYVLKRLVDTFSPGNLAANLAGPDALVLTAKHADCMTASQPATADGWASKLPARLRIILGDLDVNEICANVGLRQIHIEGAYLSDGARFRAIPTQPEYAPMKRPEDVDADLNDKLADGMRRGLMRLEALAAKPDAPKIAVVMPPRPIERDEPGDADAAISQVFQTPFKNLRIYDHRYIPQSNHLYHDLEHLGPGYFALLRHQLAADGLISTAH